MYYSFPLLSIPMAEEFGVSKPQVYLAATIGLLVSSVASYFVGAAIDRGHGRAIMTFGSAFGGALLVLWSDVQSLYGLYAIFLGVGLALSMTLYEPGFAVIARRFGSDSRRGITRLTLWGGFASTVFIPLTQWLIDVGGWRHALIALGVINIVVGASLHFAVIDKFKDRARTEDETLASTQRPVRWAMTQPIFWGLLGAFTVYYVVFGAMTFHLYPLLLERGFDTGSVVAAIACIGPAQVAGRIAVAALAKDRPIRVVGMGAVLVLPIAIVLFNMIPVDFRALAIVAVLWGATNGIVTIVRGNAVPEMLTSNAYGAINGAITAPVTMAIALAPVCAAALWAQTGSYQAVIWVAFALGLVVVGCFWFAALQSVRGGAK
ncbi:MAG: MFS transporter [Gammaproteobacteria bacterium]|nr:MFS transporter [Gammaproteobacteria bacterium]